MRESIWSIPPGTRVSYFILFTLLTFSGTGLYIWNETARQPHQGILETIIAIISGTSVVGVASATIAITITEGARYTMVIAQWFSDKYVEPLREKRREEARKAEEAARQAVNKARAKGHAEGRVEGRAEGHAEGLAKGRFELAVEIRAWEQRRKEAEARGETFYELPPYAEKNGTEPA